MARLSRKATELRARKLVLLRGLRRERQRVRGRKQIAL
jgi:hypothetical protein